MTRLLGPDFISLQVRDFAVSRAFYTETLGLGVDSRFDTPDFVLFDSSTIPFAITEAKADLDEASSEPGWGMALWIDCDDVDGLGTRLEAAGATVIEQPFDGPFGRTLVFADPDGYTTTANENPWDRFSLGGGHQR